jgi:hypothetical protein
LTKTLTTVKIHNNSHGNHPLLPEFTILLFCSVVHQSRLSGTDREKRVFPHSKAHPGQGLGPPPS